MPPADRVDWWREITSRDLVPTAITVGDAGGFQAAADHLQLGAAGMSALEFTSLRSDRTRRLIRSSDPEWWEFGFVRAGTMLLERDRTRTVAGAGDMLLFGTSHPYEAHAFADAEPARLLLLHIPRSCVPFPERRLLGSASRPFPSQSGPGALLARFMAGCAEQMASLDASVARHLEPAAIGLATAFAASLMGEEDRMPPTRQEALALQVRTFVLDHLHEPGLSPAVIAAAHGISVRYLHHLFHESGESVGEFIRSRRLRKCCADLLDPALKNVTVSEVGARWGFQDGSSFNRAFKARYGIPPGEHRRLGGPRPHNGG